VGKPNPNAPCPCGSGRKLKQCCGRLHQGATPESAEALMRSRYAAYALGRVPYLMATTHPDGPHWRGHDPHWATELAAHCAATTFTALRVLGTGPRPGGEAWVQFEADFEQGGAGDTLRERSRFAVLDGKWVYVDGVVA
jgi:SEC-C motif-containing protein